MKKGILDNNLVSYFLMVFTILVFGVYTQAQTIDSTTALKFACENNPNNLVTIDYPAKISNGAGTALPEQINTGCNILIAPSGSFETDQIGLNFNGTLLIQSSSQTQIKVVKSLISSNSINLTANGEGSLVSISESLLKTNSGDLLINLGNLGVLDLSLPLNGGLNSLESSAAVNISGGSKFEANLLESQILAGTGINVSLGGAEGIFKTDRSNLVTSMGTISISSQGLKSLVELGFGRIDSTNGVNITLPGSEGNLVLQDMRVNSGAGSIVFDVARIGSVGKIKVAGSFLNSGAAVSLVASLNGRRGSVLVENTNIVATNPITVRTGRLGETIATTNNFRSSNSILIRTGVSGSCLSEQNILTAPVVQSCR